MEKLTLELQALLLKQANQHKERNLLESDTDAPISRNNIEVVVRYQTDYKPLEAIGLVVNTSVFNYLYGTISIDKLSDLAQHPNVVSIEQTIEKRKHLDNSIPNINAASVRTRSGNNFTGTTGEGVIVGIIDTGIDYQHKSFRNSDGPQSTRILKIWDQTLSPQGGEGSPANYNRPPIGTANLNYGVEYSQSQINTALGTGNPLTTVRHKDEDGHGTHVASIAAGDGSVAGNCKGEFTYVGVAPKAEFIIVRMRGLTTGDAAQQNNDLINAILYIEREAAARPVAINMSLGNSWGPRDGTDPDAINMDQILNTRTTGGFVLIKSAGNEADNMKHAEATIGANGTPSGNVSIEFEIGANRDNVRLEIRYNGSNVTASLSTPNVGGTTQTTAVATIGSPVTANLNNSSGATGGTVSIQNTTNRILVSFTPPASGSNLSGIWKINLANTTATPTKIDSWLSNHDSFRPVFRSHETNAMTIAPDSSGQDVIIVGAHAAEGNTNGQIANFSSRGPTFDGRTKPDLTAPGVSITSAAIDKYRHDDGCDCIGNCCCTCCQDFYRNENGTSQAAPHVTGSVALLLSQKNALTFSQIKTILQESSTAEGTKPNNDWGWGRLNVSASLSHALATPAPAPVAPVVVPFMGNNAPPQYPTFQTLQERILAMPKGQHLRKIGRDLFEEMRVLVNTNKRVATVWHRCAGPAWLRTTLRLVNAPYEVIPEEMNGVKLNEGIDRMSHILKKYGSPLLIENLNEWQNELQILRGGISIFQLYDEYELVIIEM
jgi:subtilisin family serine protease